MLHAVEQAGATRTIGALNRMGRSLSSWPPPTLLKARHPEAKRVQKVLLVVRPLRPVHLRFLRRVVRLAVLQHGQRRLDHWQLRLALGDRGIELQQLRVYEVGEQAWIAANLPD